MTIELFITLMPARHIVILAERLYEDLELWYPKIYFEAKGYRVTIVAPEKKTYEGKNGYPVEPGGTLAGTDPASIDALIVPGGFAPDYLRRSKPVLKLVAAIYKKRKTLAAICHAGSVLISAGVVKGRKLTGFSAIKDDLVNAGAEYIDAPVVVDGNLITSRDPSDLPFFCEAIEKAISRKA